MPTPASPDPSKPQRAAHPVAGSEPISLTASSGPSVRRPELEIRIRPGTNGGWVIVEHEGSYGSHVRARAKAIWPENPRPDQDHLEYDRCRDGAFLRCGVSDETIPIKGLHLTIEKVAPPGRSDTEQEVKILRAFGPDGQRIQLPAAEIPPATSQEEIELTDDSDEPEPDLNSILISEFGDPFGDGEIAPSDPEEAAADEDEDLDEEVVRPDEPQEPVPADPALPIVQRSTEIPPDSTLSAETNPAADQRRAVPEMLRMPDSGPGNRADRPTVTAPQTSTPAQKKPSLTPEMAVALRTLIEDEATRAAWPHELLRRVHTQAQTQGKGREFENQLLGSFVVQVANPATPNVADGTRKTIGAFLTTIAESPAPGFLGVLNRNPVDRARGTLREFARGLVRSDEPEPEAPPATVHGAQRRTVDDLIKALEAAQAEGAGGEKLTRVAMQKLLREIPDAIKTELRPGTGTAGKKTGPKVVQAEKLHRMGREILDEGKIIADDGERKQLKKGFEEAGQRVSSWARRMDSAKNSDNKDSK